MRALSKFFCLTAFLVTTAASADPFCNFEESRRLTDIIISDQSLMIDSERLLSGEELYKRGQYTMLLGLYGSPVATSALELSEMSLYLSTAIKRFGELCAGYTLPNSASLKAYIDLIDAIKDAPADEVSNQWALKYNLVDEESTVEELALTLQSEQPPVKVERAILVMTTDVASKSFQTVAKHLQLSGISISLVSVSDIENIDDYIDEHVIDLVISDSDIKVSENNKSKFYHIGNGSTSNQWSMSFGLELSQLLGILLQENNSLTVYTFNATEDVSSLVSDFSNITHVDFKGYAEANAYFAKLLCKIDVCVSQLHDQVSLIVADAAQTVFINSFLRLAQEAKYGKFNDATVYITSKSTWGILDKVDFRDLSNTVIYDSSRMKGTGFDLTQDGRTGAMITDIIRSNQLMSAGVDFGAIPYFGLSGTYFIYDGHVIRLLSLFRTKDLF